MSGEILVVPFHGQGHLFPCIELCIHLAARNYHITLVLPSSFASSISPSVRHHPLIQIAELSASSPPENDPHHHRFPPSNLSIESFSDFLSSRSNDRDSPPAVCAIVDMMMSWTHETFRKFKIPTVSFFTSGACSAAMEYAVWKIRQENPVPGLNLTLPGLPDDVRLTLSDLTHPGPPPPRHPGRGPPHRNHHGGGPPHRNHHWAGHPPPPPGAGKHGPPPSWIGETEGSMALLMNTCEDLERPFLDYVAKETGKRVWGVGPLLPAQFWRSAHSVVHDGEIRSKRESNVSEDDVSKWLDSQPRGSVVYVAFGTEVGPSKEELEELAAGLEESNRPFIWVLRSSAGRSGPPPPPPDIGDSGDDDFFPDGLARRAEGRGLIIQGWAPQLLILSHPSTAGFLTHCGWNSILEALGRGVPLLAWPIRGDQHYNAKLVSSHLKVGLMIRAADGASAVKKDDVVRGIEGLMADDETRNRAAAIRSVFGHSFPASSSASLDDFRGILEQICQQK
ncbi:UDP-glucosyl transferase 73B2-like [Magnolia sinica]|uniref:UDP-glucosyl transferase 73B2-like n=1 Tax=Magnolia sinica TaxID=86752 RepID=UPI00265A906D|nr:UDP-glucosyl transferase 73B2-like [Magnolia sinica]